MEGKGRDRIKAEGRRYRRKVEGRRDKGKVEGRGVRTDKRWKKQTRRD